MPHEQLELDVDGTKKATTPEIVCYGRKDRHKYQEYGHRRSKRHNPKRDNPKSFLKKPKTPA